MTRWLKPGLYKVLSADPDEEIKGVFKADLVGKRASREPHNSPASLWRIEGAIATFGDFSTQFHQK